MIFLIVFLICVFVTLAIAGLAGLSDFRTMKIPNSYSVYIILAFFICYGVLYLGGHSGVFAPLLSHLISAVVTFFVTFVLFSLKMIGAGDSKFGTACALWIGAVYMLIYLFFMTLCGAGLGLFALYVKRKKPFASPVEGSWIAQVQNGADKVPYGVAIAFGMVISFAYSGYFSTEVLSSFLASASVGSGS